ncbi:ABC-type amino acid transport/signal transduction system, periplasmic component [Rubidibacter lacunae KORDI 51-2]|uniref:ABC-type amino acid transport/signal transduction system, periplasmic component n=1 Tax=Rubidibacter lacunae KORDI 51-2 TaxID=582515 RepID=U5DIL9_9CHRO|nr:extracellular substrate binding-like orphan protein GrrP [Rubidibacter lacunae]ERN40439.1 ABC-type amino acid transport/signal transduction system, periplasmic component [Rubidibacter lacunae KORDI 51-2]
MLRKLSVAALTGILLATGFAGTASAETVLEKVARTGVLTVGARTNLIPYSYTDGQSELVGYSLDIANLIRDEVEQYLGKEIVLDIVEVGSFSDRISLLRGNRGIDMSCGVIFTWERNLVADFSMSYGIASTRLLVRSVTDLDDDTSLSAKKVGVPPGPLVRPAVELIYPDAVLVEIETYEAGMDALDSGEIDLLAGDSILLNGYTQPRGAENYTFFSNNPPIRYGVACMTDQDNSSFMNLVDYSIARFMDRYITGDPAAVAIVERWFGPEGVVPIGEDRLSLLDDFFRFQLLTRAQVPPDGIDFSFSN